MLKWVNRFASAALLLAAFSLVQVVRAETSDLALSDLARYFSAVEVNETNAVLRFCTQGERYRCFVDGVANGVMAYGGELVVGFDQEVRLVSRSGSLTLDGFSSGGVSGFDVSRKIDLRSLGRGVKKQHARWILRDDSWKGKTRFGKAVPLGIAEDQSPSVDGFDRALSFWVERVAWSAADGFVLSIRDRNKPILLREGEELPVCYEKQIRLEPGPSYMLTNGRGRRQIFEVRDAPFAELGEAEGRFLSVTNVALSIVCMERVSRAGDMRTERYLMSASGDVYSASTGKVWHRGMPLTLQSPVVSPGMQKRDSVVRSGQWHLETARTELKEALESAVVKRLLSDAAGDLPTNGVCYAEVGRFDAEVLKGMAKDGKLSPFLEEMLAQMGDRPGTKKWARLCQGDGGRFISRLRVCGEDCDRRILLDAAGNVCFVSQILMRSGRVVLCRYGGQGELMWMIEMDGDRLREAWMNHDGELVRQEDLRPVEELLRQTPSFLTRSSSP